MSLNKNLIILGISTVAISLILLGPYAAVNSHVGKHVNSGIHMESDGSIFNNHGTSAVINQASYLSDDSASLFDTDLTDEDFTGDAAP